MSCLVVFIVLATENSLLNPSSLMHGTVTVKTIVEKRLETEKDLLLVESMVYCILRTCSIPGEGDLYCLLFTRRQQQTECQGLPLPCNPCNIVTKLPCVHSCAEIDYGWGFLCPGVNPNFTVVTFWWREAPLYDRLPLGEKKNKIAIRG